MGCFIDMEKFLCGCREFLRDPLLCEYDVGVLTFIGLQFPFFLLTVYFSIYGVI